MYTFKGKILVVVTTVEQWTLEWIRRLPGVELMEKSPRPWFWNAGNCKYTSMSGKPLPVCVAARHLKKTVWFWDNITSSWHSVNLPNTGTSWKPIHMSFNSRAGVLSTNSTSNTHLIIRTRPGGAAAGCVAFHLFVYMMILGIRLFQSSVNNRSMSHAKCCGEELFTGSTSESSGKVLHTLAPLYSNDGLSREPSAFMKTWRLKCHLNEDKCKSSRSVLQWCTLR